MERPDQPARPPAPGAAAPAVSRGWRGAGGREALLAGLVFGLLAACFLWQPLLAGSRGVFVPQDLLAHYDYAFLDRQLPRPQNPVLSDVTLYYAPYADYAIHRLSRGQVPLWNPLILGGTPFYATAQPALFDPVNLLARPFGATAAWVLAAWLRLTLAGLGVYGLLRALGRGPLAGLAGGVVFMYCGFLSAWLNYAVVSTLIWLPYLLWTTLRLAETGRGAWLGLLAFCLGGQFYGGHPETSFVLGLTWAAYAGFLLAGRAVAAGWPAARRGAGRLALAAGLGLLLGAGQLLPLLDLLGQSQILVDRAAGTALPQLSPAGAAAHSLALLLVTFVPNVSGTPTEGNYWYPLDNFNEQASYCGLLALGLAAAGLIGWRARSRAFFAGAGLLAWALLIQLPGTALLYQLPGFSLGWGARWAGPFSLCVAVLAGVGLETLIAAGTRPIWRRTALAWLAGFGLLLAGVLAAYLAIRGGIWRPAGIDPGTGAWRALVRLLDPAHRTVYWPFVFALAGTALIGLLAAPGRPRPAGVRRAAGLGLLALLVLDGLTFGSTYNPVIPARQNLPPTPLTRWLRGHLGHNRLAGIGNVLLPNVAMTFGLRDLRGYEDLASQAYAGTVAGRLRQGTTLDPTLQTLTAGEKNRLDLAAVRYILAVGRLRVAGRPGAVVSRAQFDPVTVYENPGALPRVYGVYAAEFLPGPAAVRARLDTAAFDPHQVVLLEGARPAGAAGPPGTGHPTVRYQVDQPEHLALRVAFAAPGYLVVGDAWAAGWEAQVDGQPTPIWRANGMFRAVAVPPGPHEVVFTYRPKLVYGSAAVSLGALLLIGGLAIPAVGGAARSAAAAIHMFS